MAERVPVETHGAGVAVHVQQFDVAQVVAGARVRHGGAGALGLDAEHAVFQALAARVIDQRDLALRVGDQPAVVVPARHPELHLRVVALDPFVPRFIVEQARLAVQEGPDGGEVDRLVEDGAGRDVGGAHAALPSVPWLATFVASFAASPPCPAIAFFMTSSQ
ncbi:hypothetical protein D9M68_780730 [compost metagenome]